MCLIFSSAQRSVGSAAGQVFIFFLPDTSLKWGSCRLSIELLSLYLVLVLWSSWPSWPSGPPGPLALWSSGSLVLWPSGLLAFWSPSYPTTIESSPFRGGGVADPEVSLEQPGGVSCSGRWAGPCLAPHWARHAPAHHACSRLHWEWGGLFLFATVDEKGGVRGGAPAPGGRKFCDVCSRLTRSFLCLRSASLHSLF